MSRVDVHDGFCFLHEGPDIAVYADGGEASVERGPQALVPREALIAVVLRGRTPAPGVACLLLEDAGSEFTGLAPHPAARLEGDDTVVVTGPDRRAVLIGEEPDEVAHRVPLSAVRKFVLLLVEGSMIARIEGMSFDEFARLADIVLPAAGSVGEGQGAGTGDESPYGVLRSTWPNDARSAR